MYRFVLLAFALGIPPAAHAETLQDAIALAYQSNPTLLAARADLRAINERYVQARANLGPQLNSEISGTINTSHVTQPNLLGKSATTRDHADSTSFRLNAVQPLYDGGALSAGISAAKADVLAGREALRRTEATTLEQVIVAYADVVLNRQLLEIARQNGELLRQQNAEADAKVKVHEITLTDLAQSRARLLASQIRVEKANAAVANSEERYLSVVGQLPGQLETPSDLPGIPPTLHHALDAADQANPLYLRARYTELASRARIRQVRAEDGFHVSGNASASRGPVTDYLPGTRINALSATISVTKPLFTSGLHQARIREAQASNDGDALRVSDSRRQAFLAVSQAWSDLVSNRSLLSSLIEQLRQEKISFEGSRLEQRIGQRNTIDVLNAEQEYQDTKASLAQNYHDEYLDRVSLLSAMGVLQTELIEPVVDPYRPEAYLDRVVRQQPLLWADIIEAIDSIGLPRLPLDAPERDPLGPARPVDDRPMPVAPGWHDLVASIADIPSLR